MLGNKQEQEGGNNSHNNQAAGSIIYNYGPSYEDVKAITKDVFEQNFLKLSREAFTVAQNRADKLIEDFLGRVQELSSHDYSFISQPAMQIAIYNAQKEYAKYGDEITKDLLVDILIKRSQTNERNTTQIVLEESIDVIGILTQSQMDILSILLTVRYFEFQGVTDKTRLADSVTKRLKPFLEDLIIRQSDFIHLDYAKCVTNLIVPKEDLFHSYFNRYENAFRVAIGEDDFRDSMNILRKHNLIKATLRLEGGDGYIVSGDGITTVYINDVGYKLYDDDGRISSLINSNILSDEEVKLLLDAFYKRMDVQEVVEYIKNIGPFMRKLWNFWQNTNLQAMKLISVGAAIAQANYARRVGEPIDISLLLTE